MPWMHSSSCRQNNPEVPYNRRRAGVLTGLLLLLALPIRVSAGEVMVAVAANFTAAAKQIGAAFERRTGHRAVLSFGSTGKLDAQILHGAPFRYS